jgi:hypothetical protein
MLGETKVVMTSDIEVREDDVGTLVSIVGNADEVEGRGEGMWRDDPSESLVQSNSGDISDLLDSESITGRLSMAK